MLDKYPIDYPKTYNGAILQAVEPKMELQDKDNQQKPAEQAKDKNGVLKWLIYLNLEVKSTGKKKFENITITFTSPNKPFGAIPLNSPVIIESLQLGTMLRKEGGYNLYYSAESISPAQRALPSQPARVAATQ
jgi:hypothetical protein